MSGLWPSGMKVEPILEWPGQLTARQVDSPFSATWSSTLGALRRELRELGARDVILQVAIPRGAFRLDGFPRADARPEHSGVILSMSTPHGALSYPCDTFRSWQDNVRAIALALEALRKVDRYGVTKRGEQYRGFLAIEATAAPAGFTSAEAAHQWLAETYGYEIRPDDRTQARDLLRWGQRKSHPDLGGDAELFGQVALAEARLRAEGWL